MKDWEEPRDGASDPISPDPRRKMGETTQLQPRVVARTGVGVQGLAFPTSEGCLVVYIKAFEGAIFVVAIDGEAHTVLWTNPCPSALAAFDVGELRALFKERQRNAPLKLF